MRLEVYCGNRNCGEYILDTDTDVLALPLTGHMFKPRADREWQSPFEDEAESVNLTCPMCEWTFHVEQSLTVRKPDSFYPASERQLSDAKITGTVPRILKYFLPPPPKPKAEPKKAPVQAKKPEKKSIMDRFKAAGKVKHGGRGK